MKKGMTLDECLIKAEKFISENEKCLLLFDVVNSKTSSNRNQLNKDLQIMMSDLNQKFENYFPEHDLAVYNRTEKGFTYLLGDGSWTGINSVEIIPKIIEYQKINFPFILLYWSVAKNGYDEENLKIVR